MTNHLVNWLSPDEGAGDRSSPASAARFVADTLTADLTFFANGSIADGVGAPVGRSAGSPRAT